MPYINNIFVLESLLYFCSERKNGKRVFISKIKLHNLYYILQKLPEYKFLTIYYPILFDHTLFGYQSPQLDYLIGKLVREEKIILNIDCDGAEYVIEKKLMDDINYYNLTIEDPRFNMLFLKLKALYKLNNSELLSYIYSIYPDY